jgi:hypothetical protein
MSQKWGREAEEAAAEKEEEEERWSCKVGRTAVRMWKDQLQELEEGDGD